uniref:Uncharacterized protein n=1 Tax=Arundo donax TaxID=35708 RepID=A0A0A9FYP5_ARUDO
MHKSPTLGFRAGPYCRATNPNRKSTKPYKSNPIPLFLSPTSTQQQGGRDWEHT